ncbi:MAG: dienelactone hydrolase family protein [Pseudomonadota bacterium]
MSRVVFLHGVGSSGAGMRPLAEALGLHDAHCPDGPEPFDMGPGRQWFSVKGVTEANRPERVAAALSAAHRMIEALGDPRESWLVGFSQGSIMALHLVAEGLPVAGVVAIAGRLAGPVAARTDWPPIWQLQGADDAVMPLALAQATEGWLREAGAAAELTVFPRLGHSVDTRVLGRLREVLG